MFRVMPESPYSNGGPPLQGQRQAQVHNQDQVPSQAGGQRGSEALMQAQAQNQAQAQLQA